MTRTASHMQVHDAGRHLAVAEALLHGYDAKVVGPRRYIEVNGRRSQLQAAAMGSWQIEDVDKFADATTEQVVLVDLTDNRRDVYIVPGDQLRRQVSEQHRENLAAHGGSRPRNPDSKHAAIYSDQVGEWLARWDLLD
jgi:hypothetical protein